MQASQCASRWATQSMAKRIMSFASLHPSFSLMCARCVSMVLTLRLSKRATDLVSCLLPSSSSTSSSRSESWSIGDAEPLSSERIALQISCSLRRGLRKILPSRTRRRAAKKN